MTRTGHGSSRSQRPPSCGGEVDLHVARSRAEDCDGVAVGRAGAHRVHGRRLARRRHGAAAGGERCADRLGAARCAALARRARHGGVEGRNPLARGGGRGGGSSDPASVRRAGPRRRVGRTGSRGPDRMCTGGQRPSRGAGAESSGRTLPAGMAAVCCAVMLAVKETPPRHTAVAIAIRQAPERARPIAGGCKASASRKRSCGCA